MEGIKYLSGNSDWEGVIRPLLEEMNVPLDKIRSVDVMNLTTAINKTVSEIVESKKIKE